MALGRGLGSLIPNKKNDFNQTIKKTEDNLEKTAKIVENKPKTTENINSKTQKIWSIPISQISANTFQPRKYFDEQELEDLVESIKQHGILQPIVVSEKVDGTYELIAGERRLRACQKAGMLEIPAVVKTVTEQEKLELALIENIQRQDLNPIEEAFAYKRLTKEFGLTQAEVAERVGKKRPTVANTIRLLDLPEVIQQAVISGELNVSKAKVLLSIRDPREQLKTYEGMVGKTMSVREFERSVALTGKARIKPKDPNILAKEQELEELLGTKVRIKGNLRYGVLQISYNSADELRRILEALDIDI